MIKIPSSDKTLAVTKDDIAHITNGIPIDHDISSS